MQTLNSIATPNLNWMQINFYFQIFGISILLLICFAILVYLLFKYKNRKKIINYVQRTSDKNIKENQQTLIQKIHKSQGKDLIINLIQYFQNFSSPGSFDSIEKLFQSQWFSSKEIQNINLCLYKNEKLNLEIEDRIKRLV